MRSFFAMIWDPNCEGSSRSAAKVSREMRGRTAGLIRSLKDSGFELHDLSRKPDPNGIIPLGGQTEGVAGALFGTVFESRTDRHTPVRVTRIEGQPLDRLRASGGRSLVRQVWGDYVAFLKVGSGHVVIAGPTSALPCFYMQRDGVLLVFSHLEKCPFLDLSRFTINFGFVRAMLAYDKLQTGETGLNEVSELAGGHRLLIADGRAKVDSIWDPRVVAADVLNLDLPDAEAALRSTTGAVVRAWASSYDKLLVSLSGGLDSSIVLSCTRQEKAPGAVTAVHHILDHADPSELRFARAAASFGGTDLEEVEFSGARELPGLDSHPLTARPYRQFLAPDLAATLGGTVIGRGDVILTGQGGDHLFLTTRNPLVFADFVKSGSGLHNLPRELLHAARLSGLSLWGVLDQCLPAILGKKAEGGVEAAVRLRRTPINAAALDALHLPDLLPQWVTDSGGLPPAKFNQVTSLLHLFQIRSPLDRSGALDVIHPLISQPLIELCLRLPVHILCAQGRSRGLARQAFRNEIPELIRERMTKAGASRHYVNRVTLNRDALLDALGAGALAGCGLVDRSSVDQFIAGEQYRNHAFGHMVPVYYAIECWLRAWLRFLKPQPSKSSSGT